MATMTISKMSRSLGRMIEFNLILPETPPAEFAKDNPHYQREIITVFLLHGYSGNQTDFLYNTPVSQLSMKYNLAFCMPSGENSFYLDAVPTGHSYATLVGVELPEYLRKTFGIAKSPETTFIGGNSMGGFGAIHTALMFPETFGGCIGLSSALIHRDLYEKDINDMGHALANPEYYISVFGPLKELEHSPNNPEVLVKGLLKDQKPIPKIYLACGAQDFLIEQNRSFHAFLDEKKIPHHYVEGDGIHNWDYWIPKLQEGLAFLLEA